MLIAIALIVLALLAYLGSSLVMLASVAGMAIALWAADHRTAIRQMFAGLGGGLAGSLLAEVVHLIVHIARGDAPDHGGFWLSAVLVALINAAAIAPIVWMVKWWPHRTRQGNVQPPHVVG